MKVLYFLCVVFIISLRPVREMFRALTRPQRAFLSLFVVSLLAAQYGEGKSKTYPFVYWGMYSDASDNGEFWEFRGIRRDGTEFPFPVAKLIRVDSWSTCPTPGKRLPWVFRSLGTPRFYAPDKKRAKLEAEYDEIMRAAWGPYAARNHIEDVVAVDVYFCEFNSAEYRTGDDIYRRLAWRVDLDGVGVNR